jgi:ribosomal protein S18 acetylase RimI-like enzyme
MTTPTIRIATAEDASLLAELAARTFHDTFAAENRPEDMKDYMDEAFSVTRLAEELADPLATFFLASVDGEPAGYAKLQEGEPPDSVEGGPAIELARLYADHRWHGRGVGTALIEACLDAARRGGFATMWLGVWERNWRAIAFYRKWGFEACGSKVFQLGSDPQTDLVMRREV